jgi:hypothetical protein
MRRKIARAGLGMLYLLACCSMAVAAKDDDEEEPPIVVRVYRVVDLVVPSPSYRYQGTYLPAVGGTTQSRGSMGGGMGGGMMGGMGGGMFQVADNTSQRPAGGGGNVNSSGAQMAQVTTGVRPETTNRIDMDSLIDAITTTVDPQTWDEVGGPGSISEIGNTLAINQTEAVHAKVKEFLEMLRRENGTLQVVTTEATWLSLTREQLASLEPKVEGAIRAGAPIQPAALAALPPETQRYHGQITSFNGQTVHLVSGQIKSTVLGAIPVVGSSTAYQPVVAEPHLGVLIEVTPTALSADEGVLIDLHSTITNWQKASDPKKIGNSNGQSLVEIDQINIAAQQFATSLRLPRGKPVLVGGINIPTTDDSGRQEPSDSGLYLVVTVHAGS